MDIEPDGSLCRITSSAKKYPNNIMIVKLPDDEQKSSNLTYKLVSIFPDKTHESSSDKSDDDDYIDDKLEIKLREMSKNKNNKALGDKNITTKANNSKIVEHQKEQEFRTKADGTKDRRISHDHRFGPRPSFYPRHHGKNRKRRFSSSGINRSYTQKSTPTPAKDMPYPWSIDPQCPYVPLPNQNYPPFNNLSPVLNTSGDSSFSGLQLQYNHNLNNNFPNQAYWGEEYISGGYSRPLPDMQTPLIQQGYINGYQQNQRNKNWSRKRNENVGHWKSNKGKPRGVNRIQQNQRNKNWPRKRNKNVGGWKRNEIKPRRDRMESNAFYEYHR